MINIGHQLAPLQITFQRGMGWAGQIVVAQPSQPLWKPESASLTIDDDRHYLASVSGNVIAWTISEAEVADMKFGVADATLFIDGVKWARGKAVFDVPMSGRVNTGVTPVLVGGTTTLIHPGTPVTTVVDPAVVAAAIQRYIEENPPTGPSFWVGENAPTTVVGSKQHDVYLDLTTYNLYRFN